MIVPATMDDENRTVECASHGAEPATFVCKHLAQSLLDRRPVGFWSSGDPSTPRPDAWCTACEQKLQSTGGEWNDESEAFASVTMICGACYDLAREINSRPRQPGD